MTEKAPALNLARHRGLFLVAEIFRTVVAPHFLIQSDEVVFPPCSSLCFSLSCLLLYILTFFHLWFFMVVEYLATTLVVTRSLKD